MKTASTCFAAILLAAAASPVHADPTPGQRTEVENCKIMSGAVFQFAKARDRKQAKMDAFKDVTHGQTYVPGSLLDETLQWAYAHPDEQPDTASGHFYGRCLMDAYDARNPDSEGELDLAAQACQQGHPGAPAEVRDCIEDKAQDIITRSETQTALAVSGATSAAPAVATAVIAQTSSSADVVAVAAPPPVQTSTPSSPAPAAATLSAAPVAKAPVETSAPAVLPQAVAVAPSLPPAMPPASAAAAAAPISQTPPPPVPAAPAPEPMVAAAAPVEPTVAATPVPRPVTPTTTTQAQAEPPAPVVIPAAAPVPDVAAASAPAPVVPPSAEPVAAKPSTPAPTVAKAAVPQAVAPATALPPLPRTAAPAAGPPPDLAGFGKLTVGMPMDEAFKAMGSHGDTDWDQQGEVHTYMIGDDHGFIEIRPSSGGTLYSIRVVGGADAHVAPILNVVLGDGAFVLINNVGMPNSRTPLPGDKELWNYVGRNYAFEISPGGDVIGVRITDTGSSASAAQ